jgi:putative flippase GtrA
MRAMALAADAMRLLGEDRVRYVLVSTAALALDTLITLNLTWSGLAPAPSAAAGYIIGLMAHWSLSTRFVFAEQLAQEGAARARQALLFTLSGFSGLAITVAVYTSAIALGGAPSLAKALAVALSFCIVYLVRRHLIFPQRS